VLNLFILAGITVPGLILIYFLLRREIRRSFSSNELFRQVESEVDSVITELNRTTERNITLIEDKIRQLSQLVRQADHRITLMQKERESGKDRGVEKEPPSPKSLVYPRPVRSDPPKQPDLPIDLSPPAVEPEPGLLPEKRLTRREQVMLYHRQGLERTLIASKLGITLGEVDLIVSLGERITGEEGSHGQQ
jgi:hypothetical protein